jgi:hypothetical protein
MARDIRTMPKGLIAPLTQTALASLRGLAEGDAITALGRERLICDR